MTETHAETGADQVAAAPGSEHLPIAASGTDIASDAKPGSDATAAAAGAVDEAATDEGTGADCEAAKMAAKARERKGADQVAAKDEESAANVAAKTAAASASTTTVPASTSPSPSMSSVSSMESTEKLIRSLSTHQLAATGEAPVPPAPVTSPPLATPAPPAQTHTPPTPTSTTSPTQSAVPVKVASTSAPSGSASGGSASGGSTQNGGTTSAQKGGAPTAQAGAKNDKKPVRFTVRKVSRDTGERAAAPSEQREYLYGNIPENRARAQERKNSDKLTQLQHSQRKHAEYSARVDKINKEIGFLTNLLPPYNVEIDYATRTKIMRAIEKLRMKQDEVEKKKYTLGITISRLWREHDESAIWVRSVSNQ